MNGTDNANIEAKIFENLNHKQIEAVKATEGYYRVIAGAGSGKTRTLTNRFVYLIKELGITPRNILCVTFTNKAANEMKSRIRKLLGDEVDNALITTYHGFCVKVLKEDINKLFFPNNFKIIDVADQKKIINEIYDEYDIKLDYNSFEKTLEFIYTEKTHLAYIPPMCDPAHSYNLSKAGSLEEKIYWNYLNRQKKIFGLDFNDLMYFVIYMFDKFEEVINKWRSRIHYIQVDEFQDSSKKELDVINALCSGNNNLFVVGDPDQNIYEWRNSDNRFLVHFNQNYPDVKTIILDQNYRSAPEILAASNSLIEKNKNRIPKNLFTKNPHGKKPEHIHSKSDNDESKWIIKKIKELTADEKNKYSDIAILYRSTNVSRTVEQTLYKEDIPYEIQGGVSFFNRMEIKDAIAYLKLIAGNDDDAFMRVVNIPKRQIGKSKLEYLKKTQEYLQTEYDIRKSLFEILCDIKEESVFDGTKANEFADIITQYREIHKEGKTKISELLNGILDKSGYKAYISKSGDMERFDNVTELLASITEFEMQIGEDISLSAYLQQLAVISDYEIEKVRNCVKLMTIHASKGLEFPYVIVVGMTEGIFPSRRTLEDRKDEGLEEERRLCYVAATRAMRELYFCESEGNNDGESRKLPSRFLFDIDAAHINIVGFISEDIMKDLKGKIGQNKNPELPKPTNAGFSIGDTVYHKAFKKGKIIGLDTKNDAYMIKFDELPTTKPINRTFKGLELYSENVQNSENMRAAEIKPEEEVIIESFFTEPEVNTERLSLETPKQNKRFDIIEEQIKPAVEKMFRKEKSETEKTAENIKISEAETELTKEPEQTVVIPPIEFQEHQKSDINTPKAFNRRLDKYFSEPKSEPLKRTEQIQFDLSEPEKFKSPIKPEEKTAAQLQTIQNDIIEYADDNDDFDITEHFNEITEQIKNRFSTPLPNLKIEQREERQKTFPDDEIKEEAYKPVEQIKVKEKEVIFTAEEDVQEEVTGRFTDEEEQQLPDMPQEQDDIAYSLNDSPPEVMYDNEGVNLWNDPDVPKKGWICVDVVDLGYPYGVCGMCGKEEIRYVHIMKHSDHPTIGTGCICAGKMEGDVEKAKGRESELKNKINRYKSFFKKELKTSAKGNLYVKYKDTIVTFLKKTEKDGEESWKYVENGEFSKPYGSIEEAKYAVFIKIDNRSH